MRTFFLLFFLLSPAVASAQSLSEILDSLNEKDQNKLLINYNEALKSQDQMVKSIVIQKALSSKDGRIRMLGFQTHVMGTQQDLVELSITEDAVKKNPQIVDHKFFILAYKNFDSQKNTFTARISGEGDSAGFVNQSGIQVSSGFSGTGHCKLQFDNATEDKILGSFTCPQFKVAATIALR